MTCLTEYLDGADLTKEQKAAIIGAQTGRVETLGGVKVPMQAILDLAAQALTVSSKAEVFMVRFPRKKRSQPQRERKDK